MSSLDGLSKTRFYVVFLIGLCGALGVGYAVGSREPATVQAPASAPTAPVAPPPDPEPITDFAALLSITPGQVPLRPASPLTPAELELARTAWSYFEREVDAKTGLVHGVAGYPSTTLWETGSYLMAIEAAQDLGIITEKERAARLGKVLASLEKVALVEGALPNKAYDTATLAVVDYKNAPVEGGIGWSAIDVARVCVPLEIAAWRHPAQTPRIRAVMARWDLGQVAAKGQLQGAVRRADGTMERVQEGRLGYEQYAAKALFLAGTDVGTALRYDASLAVATVEGQPVAYDERMPAEYDGTHNAVLSEPWILDALEFGLTTASRPMAEATYLAQQRHAEALGKLVAVSEDHLDRDPWFVYNSVLNGGVAWAAFTPEGADAAAHRSLSTKAAFGWGVLFADPYADRLLAEASAFAEPGSGFLAGRYDTDGALNRALTVNTNAVILEALWYRVRGPLLAAARRS